MRVRLVALASAFLATAAAAPDWTRTAARTPQGGIRVGNPAARVRFVEIANYTCPHCAHFAEQGGAAIGRHVRSGALAVEFRPIANNPVGLAATVVARCAAPGPFLAVNDALYAAQDRWIRQAGLYAQRNARELGTYGELDRLQQIAEHGGIAAVASAAGLPPRRIAACFADNRLLDETLAAIQASAAVPSTPTVVIGRQTLNGATWPDVAARLRAAGLK